MSKFTPGPWDYLDARTLIHVETAADNSFGAGRAICSLPKRDEANARLIAAAPDYHAAACGTDPELPEVIRPVSWLKSLIDDAKRRGPAEDDDDPSAYWEMVSECEALLTGLNAAIAKAEGRDA